MTGKIFTLQEANELLPQLMEDLQVLQAMTAHYEERQTDLQKARAREKQSPGQGEREDSFFQEEVRLDFMRMEIELLIENFARKGVLLKMIQPGLIDFPAVLEGEEILICWKQGEERITHYHGWHEGFRGRKPFPGA